MKKLVFCLLAIQFLAVTVARAQQKPVTGQVSDNKGPVAGATVTEKGLPTNGTATDAEGKFRLTLKTSSNSLIVNAIGYTRQEVHAGNKSDLKVTLVQEEAKEVGEVVVVGYAKQKKVTMTGAVSSVSGAEIRDNPSASLQNTLAGRLPGFFSVQPSGRPGSDGAQFFIRGQSSYNTGANSPLIIVDDIEFTYDQFARLDPNEIETLSILKDASTTAVYGVKGANGVVVITTRRGKTGPPKISFRGETSLQQPTKIPRFLNSYETANLFNLAMTNDNAVSPSHTYAPYFTPRDLELFRNGQDPYGHPNVDWRKELFKKFARQHRGNFDISGGTERVKYFISLGYLFQDGMLRDYSKNQDVNSNFYHQRYNYRSNLDVKVTNTTDMRLDLYGNIGEINNPNIGSPFGYNDVFYEYSSFLSLAPFAYPVYNPDGTYGYSRWQTGASGAPNSPNNNYNTNNIVGRLGLYGYDRNHENNINLIATVNQRLDFLTKGLSFKGTVSYASNYGYSRSMKRDQFPSFIYTPNANHPTITDSGRYEPRSPDIFRVRRFFIGYGAGSTRRVENFQAILNYDRTFGRHHVYGLALFNQNSTMQYSRDPTYNFIPNNFRGFTGRIGYNYREKYLFELNAGYNGSDRFSKENRYGLFPAASAGWNISEEPFIKENLHFLSRMKLRASYGMVGNDNIGGFSYIYLPTYVTGSGSFSYGRVDNSRSGIREGQLGNPAVTWEKERKLDMGIDFGFFRNTLTGTVDYFNNNRYDIMTTRGTVSDVFGQALPPVNLGEVNNKGYEIELGYNGRINKDFTYRVKGTYSFAKNKIIFRDEPAYQYEYQAFTGKSIGQQRVYQWVGFYKDSADIANSPKMNQPTYPGDLKYADLNKDGKIDSYDQIVTGYPNVPNTNYGLQAGITFKGLTFNVFFQGARNFNVAARAEAIQAFSSNVTDVHKQFWTPERGDAAKFPRLSFNAGVSSPTGNASTFWLVPGDYIRLKTAEIGYTIPKGITKRLGIEALRFYSNGYNLFTWTKLTERYDLDPEITSNTDRINYPPQRTINFGLSATF